MASMPPRAVSLLRGTGTAVPLLEARRLGRTREAQAGRVPAPRPVLLVFPSQQTKHSALKHSGALRARRIYLDDDLTPAQLQARANLGDKFVMPRQQGLHPFRRAERLFYCNSNNTPTLFQGEVLPFPPPACRAPVLGGVGRRQVGVARQAGQGHRQVGQAGQARTAAAGQRQAWQARPARAHHQVRPLLGAGGLCRPEGALTAESCPSLCGTWGLTLGKARLHEWYAYFAAFGVLMLTETKAPFIGDDLLPGFSIVSVPAERRGRAGQGLCLAVRKSTGLLAGDFGSNDWSLWVRLRMARGQVPLFLGVAYVPPAGSPSLESVEECIHAWARLLSRAVSAHVEGHVILAGDFNARIGHLSENGQASARGCTDPEVTAHGRAFLAMCEEAGLRVCTGQVLGDQSAAPTFKEARHS